MKKFISVFVIGAIVLCVALAPVRAELITIAISGQVTGINDQYGHLEDKIYVGAPITGTYTYDSAILDSYPADPTFAQYQYFNAPANILLNVGGFAFRTDPTTVEVLITVENNNSFGEDTYSIGSGHILPLINNVLVDSVSWYLNDPTGTALSSDALSLTAPDLSKWGSSGFGNYLHIDSMRSGGFVITGTITSATLVPEPVSVLLFAGGMLFVRHSSKKI